MDSRPTFYDELILKRKNPNKNRPQKQLNIFLMSSVSEKLF